MVTRGMHVGRVEWFSDETGEGCIVPDDGGWQLFVCFTDVAPAQGGAFEVLRQGSRVAYELTVGKTVLRAENVRKIG